DKGQGLLEAELRRCIELFRYLGSGRPHVGCLAFLGYVDVQVLRPGVFADDHALVNLGSRLDEKAPALLNVQDGVRGGGSRLPCHEASRSPAGNLAAVRTVTVK